MSREAEVVREHIIDCEKAIEENDMSEISKLGTRMLSIYRYKLLTWVRVQRFNPSIENLENLIHSLKVYEGELIDKQKAQELNQKQINVQANVNDSGNSRSTNNSTNNNTNTVDVKILFEGAKKEIENNGSLTEEEIEEIIEKINEIEQISEDEISRPKKWGKLKSVINWTTSKGVDIGVKMYPLIMASLEK